MFDKKVRDYLGLGKTNGDFGIEIEMEYNKHVSDQIGDKLIDTWRFEADGSLRGTSAELVTRKPHPQKDIPDLIRNLSDCLANDGVKIKKSIRAGIHVHMNMQENTIGDVFRLMAVYLPLETVLTDWCGDGRQGNLFCMRSRDALGMTEYYTNAVKAGDLYMLRTDDLRYCTMNLQSLFLYGSVEFRALATDPDLTNIITWCKILGRLKEFSLQNKSVWEITSEISGMGPRHWAQSVLGEDIMKLVDSGDLERDIMEDLRNNQYLLSELNKKGL